MRLRILLFPALLALTATAADPTAAVATKYRATADKLIDAALADNAGLARLEYLCYRIGNRLSGSSALEQAVTWSAEEMKRAGLENVRTIPAKVPHWVRGSESAEVVAPFHRPLFILGLGGSVATPPGGITGEVVAVSTFEEMEKLGRSGVEGKIVLYDAPFVTYGETVSYRVNGAARAAKLGATAALVRSITPRSLRDPHTGATIYPADGPKIPTAAVSVEDAIWLHHLAQAGEHLQVHLDMEAHTEPDADSADVMGEIRGSEKPDEVVVIGGHIDSWDVGQGAHDDGGGIMAALEAAALIKKLGLKPRRTIRVVFWTNEENGGRGGRAYRDWIDKDVAKHVAAIEMDGGAEQPVGFDVTAESDRQARSSPLFQKAAAISQLLKRVGAARVVKGSSEADVAPLFAQGVPALALRTVMTHYFDYHHSQADTFDKIVPDEFRRCTAAFAVMSYVLADWP